MTKIAESRTVMVDVIRCDGPIVSGAGTVKCSTTTQSFTTNGVGETVLTPGWCELREVNGAAPVLHFCGWEHMNTHVRGEHARRHPPTTMMLAMEITTLDEVLGITVSGVAGV